jgi:uncharacterized membrane protein (Fun14 family)
MSAEHKDNKKEGRRKRGDWWFLFVVLILFLLGLSIRGYGYITRTAQSTKGIQPGTSRSYSQRAFSNTLREGEERIILPEEQMPSGGKDWLNTLAPYLTEGGLSFFLGFCIGYFLRIVAKTAILFIGALYVGLILLSHYGMITVDWGSFQHILQQILLNTKTHIEGLYGIITVGFPSAAIGCVGIWRGLKKPN